LLFAVAVWMNLRKLAAKTRLTLLTADPKPPGDEARCDRLEFVRAPHKPA
jgi:hypothetical protein